MFSPSNNLKLIERLRTLRINTTTIENNAAATVETTDDLDTPRHGDVDAVLNDLNEIFSENFLSDDDDAVDERSGSDDEESCAAEAYAICETIDESMYGLYSLDEQRCFTDGMTATKLPIGTVGIEYDWVLDGDHDDDGLTPKSRRRKRFGEPSLDRPLEMMELEDPSLVTASCSPDSILDETLESGEGIIEFADFSEFDCAASKIEADDEIADEQVGMPGQEEKWTGFASIGDLNNTKQTVVKFDDQVDNIPIEPALEDDSFIGCVVDTSNEHETSSEYQPPREISQLVSDLDAELDITIDECLKNTSVDYSVVEEEECSLGNSLESRTVQSSGSRQSPPVRTQKGKHSNNDYQQSLLMSSMLMESLPMPIPDMDTDVLATFTYRVQKSHREAVGLKPNELNTTESSMIDDDALEKKLIDTIHSGYFEGVGGDDEVLDSIVLDEVLNVPWPFHHIDLNESILEDEYDELEPEDIDSSNELNFDSYIFNRLSQLDIAKGEVMKYILSRVSLKEKSIQVGTERILAAELDIATALMYANSSRESVQRMLNGYQVDQHPTAKSERHNAILGSLAAINIADARDRVGYLGDVIQRISDICDKEILFWKEIPNMKSHSSLPLRPEQYKNLIELARKLYQISIEEEVLNHITSLHSLRDRIQGLSGVLLECMEDSIADLVRRMLNADDVCNGVYEKEYGALVDTWISCCQMKGNSNAAAASQMNVIADGWAGCLLKVFCFEISKACVYSLTDIAEDNVNADLVSIQVELDRLKCSLVDESDIESLMNRLLGDHRLASSSFPPLASRSTEILLVYCIFLEWHAGLNGVSSIQESSVLFSEQLTGKMNRSCAEIDNLSSISTDYSSLSPSSAANKSSSNEEDKSQANVPQSFELKNESSKPDCNVQECMSKSMNTSIRHTLFTYCESKLTQSVEICPASSAKISLEDLRTIDDIFHQFCIFSQYFLGNEYNEDSDTCENIEMALAELYRSHLRHVHIEAMKTTGTLLRHESWHLSPLDFTLPTTPDDEKKSDAYSNEDDEQNTVMVALQSAIFGLVSGFVSSNDSASDHQVNITHRAVLHGHDQFEYVKQLLDVMNTSSDKRCHVIDKCFQLHDCDALKMLTSFVIQFTESQPLSLSIMTQSSTNGLLKWATRLLSIGITLPSITDDVCAALMALFDLYILTVFRICGHSKINEDALIGMIQKQTVSTKTSTSISLTIEADICSPLCGEDLSSLQNYINQARMRLEDIVNLDKFEASTAADPSPRSNKDIDHAVYHLEKEIAAAVSCIFVAHFADVLSQLFSSGVTNLNLESSEAFTKFTTDVLTMTPQLVRQSCRLACARAISGKEVIFQIICIGSTWEDDDIQEYSNAYVEDLSERCVEVWRCLSLSCPTLPNPVLKYAWDHVVRAAFHTLIEGFSKVTTCSTGGRSLMSMDLNTLSDCLNPNAVKNILVDEYPSLNPPPASSCRGEGKQYVDAYIKVFFYPDEVLHQWITENHKQYREDHMLSLISTKRAVSQESERFWELLEESIKALYRNYQ